jgi:benzoyl-CoA reductase/2-hydroxyglutaryl-CoA dehydratase subunit BcrC/BadD/HgdB
MKNYEGMWKELGLDVELHKAVLADLDKKFEAYVLSQKNRPGKMRYFDDVIHGAHGARVAEIIEHKKRGGKFIGTFCIYVPEEIVLALDVIPVALCGGTALSIPYAERTFPRNICPLLKSTLGLSFSKTCAFAPIKDMAVGETTCDAKKKTWDILSKKVNFHVMEVPQKKRDKDLELWRDEVVQFKERLEGLTGNKLDGEKLSEAVRLMNRKRSALARLHAFRKEALPPISGLDFLVVMQGALIDDARRYWANLEDLNAELEDRVRKGHGVAGDRAKRLVVSGCPSVLGNWKLHHLLESSGAVVVCDESCTGTRYFEHLVEEDHSGIDGQLRAIADRYMKIDYSCFSPNEERITNIVKLARDYKADGVVQYILQYCHTYNVEAIAVASALKKEGLPSLKIETDYSEEDTGQLRLRIEAFLESLEKHAKL